jgi:hypothetical protein
VKEIGIYEITFSFWGYDYRAEDFDYDNDNCYDEGYDSEGNEYPGN